MSKGRQSRIINNFCTQRYWSPDILGFELPRAGGSSGEDWNRGGKLGAKNPPGRRSRPEKNQHCSWSIVNHSVCIRIVWNSVICTRFILWLHRERSKTSDSAARTVGRQLYPCTEPCEHWRYPTVQRNVCPHRRIGSDWARAERGESFIDWLVWQYQSSQSALKRVWDFQNVIL